jgi:hypothetical protein
MSSVYSNLVQTASVPVAPSATGPGRPSLRSAGSSDAYALPPRVCRLAEMAEIPLITEGIYRNLCEAAASRRRLDCHPKFQFADDLRLDCSPIRTRLLIGRLLVRVQLGELSLSRRTGPPHQLPASAESDSSRRSAFSAFPASTSADLAAVAALSISTESDRGPKGTVVVPLAPRHLGPKLSDSLVTTPRGVTGPVSLGPRCVTSNSNCKGNR